VFEEIVDLPPFAAAAASASAAASGVSDFGPSPGLGSASAPASPLPALALKAVENEPNSQPTRGMIYIVTCTQQYSLTAVWSIADNNEWFRKYLVPLLLVALILGILLVLGWLLLVWKEIIAPSLPGGG